MREYRFYKLLTGTNHIRGPVKIRVCQNDTEATVQARKMLDERDVEVWDGARFVARVQPIVEPEKRQAP
jgi:hypothetical protein